MPSSSSYPAATTPDLQVSTHINTGDRRSRRCDICKKSLPGDGEYRYRVYTYWDQRFCGSHEHDGTPKCCSCERLVPNGAEYFAQDGWNLCTQCGGSRVRDMTEFHRLYHNVRLFFESLELKVEQNIPVLPVTQNVLYEVRGGINVNSNKSQLRGLCKSVQRTFRTTGFRVSGGIYGDRMVPLKKISPETLTLLTPTQILILYGLPRLLTGSVLAHEMMHDWLKLNVYVDLREDVEEGICQVLSFMCLESELQKIQSRALMKGYTPELRFEEKLGSFYKHKILHNVSPTYGGGFRKGWEAVQKYGLHATLIQISATGSFPS